MQILTDIEKSLRIFEQRTDSDGGYARDRFREGGVPGHTEIKRA